MKILYVNPCGTTDLSSLLERSGADVSVVPPTYLITADICSYDAFVFDGTGTATGLLFRPDERVVADRIAYGGQALLCILCFLIYKDEELGFLFTLRPRNKKR